MAFPIMYNMDFPWAFGVLLYCLLPPKFHSSKELTQGHHSGWQNHITILFTYFKAARGRYMQLRPETHQGKHFRHWSCRSRDCRNPFLRKWSIHSQVSLKCSLSFIWIIVNLIILDIENNDAITSFFFFLVSRIGLTNSVPNLNKITICF